MPISCSVAVAVPDAEADVVVRVGGGEEVDGEDAAECRWVGVGEVGVSSVGELVRELPCRRGGRCGFGRRTGSSQRGADDRGGRWGARRSGASFNV